MRIYTPAAGAGPPSGAAIASMGRPFLPLPLRDLGRSVAQAELQPIARPQHAPLPPLWGRKMCGDASLGVGGGGGGSSGCSGGDAEVPYAPRRGKRT